MPGVLIMPLDIVFDAMLPLHSALTWSWPLRACRAPKSLEMAGALPSRTAMHRTFLNKDKR